MAEMGHPGSITSVTEEESSSDSDTTESYTNITSSLLSSTDTDDKLTPDLNNISISKSPKQTGNSPKRRKCNNTVGHDMELTKPIINDYSQQTPSSENNSNYLPRSESTGFIFPYGSSPRPLGKLEDRNLCSPLEGEVLKQERKFQNAYISSNIRGKISGLENSEKSSTNYSDSSSSKGICSTSSFGNVDCSTERTYQPDWTCPTWYQAKCFDHYWKHYNFVMEWYQQHVIAVKTLQNQPGMIWSYYEQNNHCSSHKKIRSESARIRRKKHLKNIRKRKKAKNAASNRYGESLSVSDSSDQKNKATHAHYNKNSANNEGDEDIEMEMTEEMADFIKTSMIHKMERDNTKKNSGEAKEGDSDIEISKTGQQNPSTSAPTERPGIRRAAELKELYGAGAPMIHGMETALQMTYDRDLDRFKPKLWPNMPLKIVFS